MKKRYLSLLLVCICILLLGTISVSAAKTTEDDFSYTVSAKGTCTITGYSGTETELVIPAEIDGYPVVTIGEYAFEYCTSLTSIRLPESITSIESNTFYGCTSLSSITLPEGITSIESYTFYGCSSLTSITIPESVTSIGGAAFEDCSSLPSITIPDSVTAIKADAFLGCNSLTAVNITDLAAWCKIEFSSQFSNPLYHGENLCLNGILVTDLAIPEGITSIRNYAFPYCTSRTITLPDSVTSIGNLAFFCCDMTSVAIPVEMMSIEEHAFAGCFDLETVYYDGEVDEWEDIYIAANNTPLLNARRQNCVRVKLTDEADKTQTLICEPGQPISISQVEAIYKRRVTLYTDAALTQPFDLSTPITERITLYVQLGEELVAAALCGQVCSYNPQTETVIQLLQNGVEKYSVTIPAEASGSGQITQAFSIPGVAEGTYDLVVSKAGHLTFTIQGVVMGTEDLDLTTNSNAAISTITLPAGDLNGDGSINTKDRTVLNRNLNLAGSDIGNALADITGDGLVNSKDRTILTKNLNKSEENDCIIDYQEGSHET